MDIKIFHFFLQKHLVEKKKGVLLHSQFDGYKETKVSMKMETNKS